MDSSLNLIFIRVLAGGLGSVFLLRVFRLGLRFVLFRHHVRLFRGFRNVFRTGGFPGKISVIVFLLRIFLRNSAFFPRQSICDGINSASQEAANAL